MSVLPPRMLTPLHYLPGSTSDIERVVPRVPQQGEVWQIKVENPKHASPPSRESTSKVAQLENSIQFINKQHNELLKSLYLEIDSLKQKNRDLQLNSLISSDSKPSNSTLSKGVTSGFETAIETQQLSHLEEEVKSLKSALVHEREQNKKLQKNVDNYKRSVPLSNEKRSDSSMSSIIEDSESSRLFVEEALPFSLKPFVVHPADGPDRSPNLQECQAIIAQLSFHCQHLDTELNDLKKNLKDALYSQKWTPDAYLLAKAVVNEPTDGDRPSSSDSKPRGGRSPLKNITIPDSAYLHREHGSLPALRQTLLPGVIDRQKKVNTMQKKKQKNYTLARNLDNPQPPTQL